MSVEFQASTPDIAISASSVSEHEAAAVDDVGERAADQPEREHRHELGQTEQADRRATSR